MPSRRIAADPQVVWDLLVDTSRWPEWGPSVSAVELDHGDGPRLHSDSTGRVRTPIGVWIPFTVTGFVDGLRWSWRVAGIPATSHAVEPHPDGCVVRIGVPVLAAPYALVCEVGLRRIERLALAAGRGAAR